jgi:hypothetical protein
LKSQRINLRQIRILKAHLHKQNCLQTDLTMNRTKPFNSETSMRIKSRKKSEFRSHERNNLFDHSCNSDSRAGGGDGGHAAAAAAAAPCTSDGGGGGGGGGAQRA